MAGNHVRSIFDRSPQPLGNTLSTLMRPGAEAGARHHRRPTEATVATIAKVMTLNLIGYGEEMIMKVVDPLDNDHQNGTCGEYRAEIQSKTQHYLPRLLDICSYTMSLWEQQQEQLDRCQEIQDFCIVIDLHSITNLDNFYPNFEQPY